MGFWTGRGPHSGDGGLRRRSSDGSVIEVYGPPGDEGRPYPYRVGRGDGLGESPAQGIGEQTEVSDGACPHRPLGARWIRGRGEQGAEGDPGCHRLIRQERDAVVGPSGHRGGDGVPGIEVPVGTVAAQRYR
jgi:hypothetical protein